MKYDGSRAAQDRYEDLAEPDARGEIRAVCTDEISVHMLVPSPENRYGREGWQTLLAPQPAFLEGWQYERAACGRYMKVVLPLLFDDADPAACRRCIHEAKRWSGNPTAWWREQLARERARSVRQDEERDVAEWQAAEEQREEAQRRPFLPPHHDEGPIQGHGLEFQ